jgi:hypothetical protein
MTPLQTKIGQALRKRVEGALVEADAEGLVDAP